MTKRILIIFLCAATLCYSFYGLYELVYLNQSPFVLECVGVRLDASKKYVIANTKPASADALHIDFPQGEGVLPSVLGTISFDQSQDAFQLKTGGDIFNPENRVGFTNPFLAFARTFENSYSNPRKYFEPESIVSAEVLKTQGIAFNSIYGDKSTRVTVRFIEFDGKTYLKTSDDGIGVKYPVQTGVENKFAVLCKKPLNTSLTRIFYFNDTVSEPCDFTIAITPQSTFNYTYKVLNQNGETIKSGTSSDGAFQVGENLFQISPKYKIFDIISVICFLAILTFFQIFFIRELFRTKVPTTEAFIAVRLLLNCLALLSIPLFLTALSNTSNRQLYLVCLVILNASYWMPKRLLHNFNFNFSFKKSLAVSVLLGCLGGLIYFFTENESLFGLIPVLHVQKLIILGLIYLTNVKQLNNLKFGYWIRLLFILGVSAVLSLLTSDFGSLIYVFFAFLLVELIQKTVSLKAVIGFGLIAFLMITIFYNFSDNAFADRKFYRIVAPYTAPDSEHLSIANQADRETFSSLHLIQKNLADDKLPPMNRVLIPTAMRSTSFSDFAFFWSLVFGKKVFAALFFPVLFLLIYHLAFLLFISIRPIQINIQKAFILPATRASEFVRFLLAFSIITLIYPVLSNLLLVPLTGQSFPCLSISIIEVLFIALFLIVIESIFSNPEYVVETQAVEYRYADLLKSLHLTIFIFALVMAVAVLIKGYFVKNNPESYRWQKTSEESGNEEIFQANRNELKKNASDFISEDKLTSIPRKKKAYLKNLASFYYLQKPYNQVLFESPFFQNSMETVSNQISLDSIFSVKRTLVSGSRHPFGEVFSFRRLVNGKSKLAYTNDFYASIPEDAETINADLTAKLSEFLSRHIDKIGVDGNNGSIVIINNETGGIIANSTNPVLSELNSNEIHYNIGSLKKIILAYAALAIDPNYKLRVFNGKSFSDFIKFSDDVYAAELLKDIMQNHEKQFAEVLQNDFNLPLTSQTKDAFFDRKPAAEMYSKPLDRKNELYRYSIGQQKPYQFINVVEWYARIAAGKKISLNYGNNSNAENNLSIRTEEINFLREAMNGVLTGGTADIVGGSLKRNSVRTDDFIAKTGTAESASKNYNTSSSIIIADKKVTIGIMLKGKIPANEQNLAAKNLLSSIVPILKEYGVLR
jgi:hypothetical protein